MRRAKAGANRTMSDEVVSGSAAGVPHGPRFAVRVAARHLQRTADEPDALGVSASPDELTTDAGDDVADRGSAAGNDHGAGAHHAVDPCHAAQSVPLPRTPLLWTPPLPTTTSPPLPTRLQLVTPPLEITSTPRC
jgi:hypothetical protein